VHGKRKGKGRMDYKTGGFYEGDWDDDFKHGEG